MTTLYLMCCFIVTGKTCFFCSYHLGHRSLLMETAARPRATWRAASSPPVRGYRGATGLLQCYNPLLLIVGKCLISFKRVVIRGGVTVCEPIRSSGE